MASFPRNLARNLASRMSLNNRFAQPAGGRQGLPIVNRPVGITPTAQPAPQAQTIPSGFTPPGRGLSRPVGITPTAQPAPQAQTIPSGFTPPGRGIQGTGLTPPPIGGSPTQFKKGGKVKKAKASSASARGDGIAKKGKTKGRFI